jgi:hypothetical protein
MYIMEKTDKQLKKHTYNMNHLNKLKSIQDDGTYRKYEHGKVYAIKSNNSPLIYIGSTYRPCSYRFSIHKYNYKQWLNNNNRHYQSPFDVLQFGDCYIEILEDVNCETRHELELREKHYIHMFSAVCVNRNNRLKIIPEHIAILDEIIANNKKIVELEEMVELAKDFLENDNEIYDV